MTKNTQESKVSIVHIFSPHLGQLPNRDSEMPSEDTLKVIENNAIFLHSHNVEYIILDNLNEILGGDFLLKNISKLNSFQENKLIYVKKDHSKLKALFLTGVEIATNENIYFIKDKQIVDLENISKIEKENPLLKKNDTEFFKQNVAENFKWVDFKLYMKKNKNFWDKTKLFFNR